MKRKEEEDKNSFNMKRILSPPTIHIATFIIYLLISLFFFFFFFFFLILKFIGVNPESPTILVFAPIHYAILEEDIESVELFLTFDFERTMKVGKKKKKEKKKK